PADPAGAWPGVRLLQGPLSPAAHRSPDARAGGPHLRRVPPGARHRPARVRPAARRADHQRHEVFPQSGDVAGAGAPPRGAVDRARGARPRLVGGVRLWGGAVYGRGRPGGSGAAGRAGAAVRDGRGRARPRRDPGARQGGDAVRTGAAAARAGGAARADLPPGGGQMSAAAPRVTIVKVAEWAVARADGVIVTLGLGSCVAIMLHDPEARAGAMAHVLLPSKSLARDATNPAKFPETAVPFLIERLTALGADRRRLVAKLAGGASMFAQLMTPGSIQMGERNIVASC